MPSSRPPSKRPFSSSAWAGGAKARPVSRSALTSASVVGAGAPLAMASSDGGHEGGDRAGAGLLDEEVRQANALDLDRLEGLDHGRGGSEAIGADDVAGLGDQHDLQRLHRRLFTEERFDALRGGDSGVLGRELRAVVGHLWAPHGAEADSDGEDRDDREPRSPSGEPSETARDPFEHVIAPSSSIAHTGLCSLCIGFVEV